MKDFFAQEIGKDADNENMSTSELMPVLKAVLTDKKVIITAIIVFLFMDLCSFVVRYRKKPKAVKGKKKSIAPAPAAAEESGGDNGGGGEEGGE